jgi:hypothetical protein
MTKSRDAGHMFRVWSLLPAPASIRCRLFHRLPEPMQRRAWDQLKQAVDQDRFAELRDASDPDGLKHVSTLIDRFYGEDA